MTSPMARMHGGMLDRMARMAGALLRWVCILGWLGWATAPAVRGAVGDSLAAKLRAAIRLPEVSLEFRFGFTEIQEWHGDDDLPDPDSELASLRRRLTGQPSDAVVLRRIAQVVAVTGDSARKAEALKVATEAARAWVASSPSEPAAKRALAAVLVDAGDREEAEQLLKPLTGEGSTDAAAFAVLATIEQDRGTKAWLHNVERGFTSLITGSEVPLPEHVAAARRHYASSMGAFDRAVRLEPGEARHLTGRVRLRALLAVLEASVNPVADPERRPAILMGALFPPSALPDLEAAAKLRPEDVRIQTALLIHLAGSQLWAVMAAHKGADAPMDFLRRLPAENQDRIRALVMNLERLGDSKDARTSSQALETLAFAKGMLSFDPPATLRYAGRAFERDPHRQSSFEMALAGCIAVKEPDWARAERLVRERLRVKDGEREQLLLVKVLDQRGSGSEALETVRRARARYPDSAELQAAELLLLVKRPGLQPGADIDALSDAMLKRFQAMPDGESKMRLSRQFFCYSVIRAALNGELDEARRRVREALAQNPGDAYLAEIDGLLREAARN